MSTSPDKQALPLLPVQDGFKALRRGIIHGYPQDQWVGALAYFDTDISPKILRAQLSSLLSASTLHCQEALIPLADWMLDHPVLRQQPGHTAFVRKTMLQAFIAYSELPPVVIDWTLTRLFGGNIHLLWSARTMGASQNSASPGKTFPLGEVLLFETRSANALALIQRLAKQDDRSLARLPWARYCEALDVPWSAALVNPATFAALIAIAPPAAFPCLRQTLDSMLPEQDYAAPADRLRLRWVYARALIERLGPTLELVPRPTLWLPLINEGRNAAGQCSPAFEWLLDQVAPDPQAREKLVATAQGWSRPELRQMLELRLLENHTEQAPARARQARL